MGSFAAIGSDLIAVPLFEFGNGYAALQRSKEQIQLSAQKAIRDLLQKFRAKEAVGGAVDPAKLVEGLERIRVKLAAFQKNAAEQEQHLLDLLQVAMRRFVELSHCCAPSAAAGSKVSKTMELALIANHMLRHGYFTSYESLLHSSNELRALMKGGGDLQMFKQHHAIAAQLKLHTRSGVEQALQFCGENRIALQRQHSLLPFHLRLNQFQQLHQDKIKAIEFARAHLYEFAHEPEMQHAMVALLVNPVVEIPPSDDHEDGALSNEFTQDCNSIVSLLPVSPLEMLIRMGLIVHKTALCAPSSNNKAKCPCCDSHLGVLAQSLPMLKKHHSSFVCRVTNVSTERILVFPRSGQAYSGEALEAIRNGLASSNGGGATAAGRVVDPQTNEECSFTDLRRAFIL